MPVRDIHFINKTTVPTINHVTIKPSPIHGFGLFADKDFAENMMLCTLDGQWLEPEEYQRLKEGYSDGESPSPLNNLLVECNGLSGKVLARAYRTHYSWINHSSEPNVYLHQKGHAPLSLRTLRPIKAGEELVLDYSKETMPDVGYSERSKELLK